MRSSASLHAGRSRAGIYVALSAALAVLASGCAHVPWFGRAPAPASGPTVEYRVKRGDTPERIAAWHGVEAEQVRRVNGIDRDDALAPGRVLRVPKRPLATHALRSGDTLAQLGQWYGVDVEALIHLNDVADVRRLAVGRVIRIPATATRDGRRAAPARPRVARAPRAVAPPPPPVASDATATSPPPAARPEVDRTLAQASEAFDAADFERSLATAQAAERQLTGPLAPDDRHRLARAHLLAGMSNVALGRDEEARRSFRAAVAADGAIAPNPAQTSPKVLTVFNEAQAP